MPAIADVVRVEPGARRPPSRGQDEIGDDTSSRDNTGGASAYGDSIMADLWRLHRERLLA